MSPRITNSCVRPIQIGDVYCGCRVDHWTCEAGSGIAPLLYQGFLLKLDIEHRSDLLNRSRILSGQVETNDDW